MPAPSNPDALNGLGGPFDSIQPDGPGVVAAVAIDGEIVWDCSVGTTGKSGVPLGPSTTFYVASLAKQFTAACVGLLAAAELLDPDDLVVEYLPELPDCFAEVRISQLVHHLSGVPSLETVAADNGWPVDWWHGIGTRDYVDVICGRRRLDAPPGTTYRYSNEGYVLLACLVERVAGMPIGSFAQERLFAPLGMSHTWYRDTPNAPRPEAAGHTIGADRTLRADLTPFHFVGDGGLVSTAADLVQWSRLYQPPYPLGPELPRLLTSRGQMRDGSHVHYAWGISCRDHHGRPIHSHGGQFVGYLAKLVRFPDDRTTVVCLANRDDLALDDLARTISDSVLADRLDFSLPNWTTTLPADGRYPPAIEQEQTSAGTDAGRVRRGWGQRLYTVMTRPVAKLLAKWILFRYDRGTLDPSGEGEGSILRRRWGRRTGRSSRGTRFLVLTTVGRRSGRPRRTPLSWLPDGDAMLVCGSFGGSDRTPDWWLNLTASDTAEVEVDGVRSQVRVEVLDQEQRSKAWPRFAEIGYEAYQARTTRELPIARLHRTT